MSSYKGKHVEINGISYIIGDSIGGGGNGLVFSAHVENDPSKYAIKFLKAEEMKSKTKKERFYKEIEFCEETNHQNILRVYGHAEDDGQLCYAMPRFAGSLRSRINRDNSITLLFQYIIQLSDAIKYIHSRGIIHRDIKPENILVGEGDNLVLADFGIAHFLDSNQTKEGDWIGNKGYAAPEQLPGSNAQDVTKACDIYALGAIINELFTRKNPTGSKYTTIAEVMPVLAPLDDLVFRCRMQNPEERPTIDEVSARIHLIWGELQNSIDELYDWLSYNVDADLSDAKLHRILERACQDVISANHVFKNASEEVLRRCNLNYHMDIHYCLDENIRNLYFQRQLLQQCQRKFDYEAQIYNDGTTYSALNLNDKDEREIYLRLEHVLEKYPLDEYFSNITGRIKKTFSSCCYYHCKEILMGIDHLEKATDDLKDAPIFYIAYYLRQGISIEDVKIIDLTDHISIQWKLSDFDENSDDMLFIAEDIEEQVILTAFKDKWGIICSKKDNEHYSIVFREKEMYKQFKEYALELAKPYYVFEGDVLDVLRIYREYNGIVELYPLDSFGITHTLANLLSIKNEYRIC